MHCPCLSIDLDKLEHNARTLVGLCRQQGITVTGVTKAVCGYPQVAEAMLRGGVASLGDSRLENIHRLRDAGITAPCLLLRLPPLSGVEAQPLAPLWNRIASLAYRHGEPFYNFQGLRQYKDKFEPVWTAKYLASPGGYALPVILTNVATLISGGLTKIIAK